MYMYVLWEAWEDVIPTNSTYMMYICNKYMFTVHIQLSCSADFTYFPFVVDLYTHTLLSTPQGAYISGSRLAPEIIVPHVQLVLQSTHFE